MYVLGEGPVFMSEFLYEVYEALLFALKKSMCFTSTEVKRK